ncbi:MerR family transcriptional regulator [Allobranchiibius huperziae]|uniref:DNA-binding transcriptional MerR regulator n=1 Tax=Allobranchiibius huperziae TaxID=1874116 RepID=A0A853D9W8_9MICO|nr:MerR family transcriptional regulator [Allobranchiibius huperziae]NYJ74032.1 DNA-binding transcriptional MerR regulator [Allobranchiibius huperziae]
MKISELARRTDVPVPTLKFYLRDGLLHPGQPLNRTQASYDESHVERTRLVRALTESAGLDLSAVRAVLAVLEQRPADWTEFLGEVQLASNPPGASDQRTDDTTDTWIQQVQELLAELGWQVDPHSPLIPRLAAQLRAADGSGVRRLPDTLSQWAEAARLAARADLATVPNDPVGALRQVVVGTALIDPVLATLRRLAQQHEAVTSLGAAST